MATDSLTLNTPADDAGRVTANCGEPLRLLIGMLKHCLQKLEIISMGFGPDCDVKVGSMTSSADLNPGSPVLEFCDVYFQLEKVSGTNLLSFFPSSCLKGIAFIIMNPS